jgi:hypothetical protein
MKQLFLYLILSQPIFAMNTLEQQFYRNSFELAKILAKQKSALERSDDYDAVNNSHLAGCALHDWYNEEGTAERLRQKGRELIEQMPRKVPERICRRAKRDAEIGISREDLILLDSFNLGLSSMDLFHLF